MSLILLKDLQASDDTATHVPSFQHDDDSNDVAWFEASTFPHVFGYRIWKFSFPRDRVSFKRNHWDVLERAPNLLWNLQNRRLEQGHPQPSIVFLCFSFGSFIVKQAFLSADVNPDHRAVMECVQGVLFLGTIHAHSHQDIAETIRQCVAAELSLSLKSSALRPEEAVAFVDRFRQTCQSFDDLPRTFNTTSMYECKATSYARIRGFSRSTILVSKDLASWETGQKTGRLIPAQLNHIQIASWPMPGSEHAKQVLEILNKFVRDLESRLMLHDSSEGLPEQVSLPEQFGGPNVVSGVPAIEISREPQTAALTALDSQETTMEGATYAQTAHRMNDPQTVTESLVADITEHQFVPDTESTDLLANHVPEDADVSTATPLTESANIGHLGTLNSVTVLPVNAALSLRVEGAYTNRSIDEAQEDLSTADSIGTLQPVVPTAPKVPIQEVQPAPQSARDKLNSQRIGSDTDATKFPDLLPSEPKRPKPEAIGVVRLPCHITRPYQRNENFVGRQSVLVDLKGVLDPESRSGTGQSTLALIGLGGMGKTQTALAYVFENTNVFQVILWARADTRAKLLQSFADFAFKVGLVEDAFSNQNECQSKVLHWFENTNNQEDKKLLSDFWPPGNSVSILMTSRGRANVSGWAKEIIELTRLDEDDSIDLLYKVSKKSRASDSEESARKIVTRVDRLPLAVYQAGFFIDVNGLDFEDFLVAYDNRALLRSEIPANHPSLRYDYSLSTVWSVQFVNLDDQTRSFINIVAFFDPEEIKEDIILLGASRSYSIDLRFLSDRKKFVNCRTKLCRSGLVYRNQELGLLWMHRLVQESLHLSMMGESRQRAFELACTILFNMWPVPEMHHRRRHDLWPEQQSCATHVSKLSQYYEGTSVFGGADEEGMDMKPLVGNKVFAQLVYNAAWYYYERGLLTESEPLLDIALSCCKKDLEDAEVLLADIYGAYGGIDSERNQLQGTLDNFQKQHKMIKEAFRKKLLKRPTVREALALGGLAQGYAGLDKLSEAEVYYRKCIDAWKDAPGEPTIYQSHLGTCLTFQGDLQAADNVLISLLDDHTKGFGPNDTRSYRSALLYYALGNLRTKQGQYDDAFEKHKICLKLYTATVGPAHHSTGDAHYKVGWHLQRRGDYDEAIKSYNAALSVFKDSKEFNNEIARTRYMLGLTYEEKGESNIGQDWLVKAEELRKSIMAEEWIPSNGEASYDSLVNFWSR